MSDLRTPSNRLKNHNGTVHFADNGYPACQRLGTHRGWMRPTIEDVTCLNCIAKYGSDTPSGNTDPVVDHRDPNIIRREAERAVRRAAR